MDSRQFFTNFTAGSVSLATAFAIMHPLDTLKTQIQTNKISIRHLHKGFITSFLLSAPQGGLRLSSYEYSKQYLRDESWLGVAASSAISACFGDAISSIVKVPREVVVARLQSSHSAVSAMDTVKIIIKEQGVKGLFKGFTSTTIRDWPFMVILFTTYESLKQNSHHFTIQPRLSSMDEQENINKKLMEQEDRDTLTTIIFGGISGGLAGFLTTPFDVIKTRIMTGNGDARIAFVARDIYREGGRGFFKGGGARSLWWVCVSSMFWPIYEGIRTEIT